MEIVPEDAIAVYNEHVYVIAERKRAQWQTINYSLAIIAAIIAWRVELVNVAGPNLQYSVAVVLPIVIVVASFWVLWDQQLSLNRRRLRLYKARELFSNTAREVYGEKKPEPTPTKDLTAIIVRGFAILAGSTFCHLLLKP